MPPLEKGKTSIQTINAFGNPFEKFARQIGSFLQIGMIKIQKNETTT